MYLLDDKFSTAVAFVEGYNTAFDRTPLSGFQYYVAAQILHCASSLHWSYIIASTKVPGILEDDFGIDQIPTEFEIELTDMLIDLLEGYQAAGQPPNTSE